MLNAYRARIDTGEYTFCARPRDAAFIDGAHDAFSALLDDADRMEAELAQTRARCEAAEAKTIKSGKTAIIAITLNGILGDLMDYLEGQGITTLPKVFVQRVDAVHDKVVELGKEAAERSRP